MLRLTLTSNKAFPESSPGFAWLFSLKVLQKQKTIPLQESNTTTSIFRQWFNRLFVWSLRYLSKQQRDKVLSSFSKNIRYYTLRKTMPATEKQAATAYVDIYIHGKTTGSVWAQSLKAGDMIVSTSEYEEKTEHVHQGQILLIGDETGLPTVLGLLDNWHNPVSPVIISIMQNEADQDYISEHHLPAGTIIHRIYQDNSSQSIAEQVIAKINTLPTITATWGALETGDAKQIKKYLRDHYQLESAQNRIKGYWKRAKETEKTA